MADQILAELRLALMHRVDAPPFAGQTSTALASLRIGLLYRMRDMAFSQLSGRGSFGAKTSSHQLVRAVFSLVYVEAQLLVSRIALEQTEGGC